MTASNKLEGTEGIIVRKASALLEYWAEKDSGISVNLGIGMPTLIPNVLSDESPIIFHSENGFLGRGIPKKEEDRDHHYIDAGGAAVELTKGSACFDSLLSFTIIRGGNLDVTVLGAFEVSMKGDLANWMIPGKLTPGMGGGMELAQKARRVVVVSRHLDKKGNGKLKTECSLPLTASGCVDHLITERAYMRRDNGQFRVVSIHPDHTPESALEGMPEELKVSDSLEAW